MSKTRFLPTRAIVGCASAVLLASGISAPAAMAEPGDVVERNASAQGPQSESSAPPAGQSGNEQEAPDSKQDGEQKTSDGQGGGDQQSTSSESEGTPSGLTPPSSDFNFNFDLIEGKPSTPEAAAPAESGDSSDSSEGDASDDSSSGGTASAPTSNASSSPSENSSGSSTGASSSEGSDSSASEGADPAPAEGGGADPAPAGGEGADPTPAEGEGADPDPTEGADPQPSDNQEGGDSSDKEESGEENSPKPSRGFTEADGEVSKKDKESHVTPGSTEGSISYSPSETPKYQHTERGSHSTSEGYNPSNPLGSAGGGNVKVKDKNADTATPTCRDVEVLATTAANALPPELSAFLKDVTESGLKVQETYLPDMQHPNGESAGAVSDYVKGRQAECPSSRIVVPPVPNGDKMMQDFIKQVDTMLNDKELQQDILTAQDSLVKLSRQLIEIANSQPGMLNAPNMN